MNDEKRNDLPERPTPIASAPDAAPAWEMVEAGRYMPRRFRGSFRGRELG